MARMAQLVGCLKILKLSFKLNFSLTMEELSSLILSYASALSSSLRNLASEADRGRYQKAKTAKHTVQPPSMMKR